jgi:hypothetical protein
LGNFDASVRLVDTVYEQATYRKDALRVNFATLNSLGNKGKFNLALDLAADLLDELGVKLPRKPHAGRVLQELARMKLHLRGWSYNDLTALPHMEDNESKAALIILSQTCICGTFL